MHSIKTLSALLLAATAAIASPVDIGNGALVKRVNGDGGAGAYIVAGKDVSFTSVAGTVKMPDISKAKEKDVVSYWIGIDGIGVDGHDTGRVIQAGFDATKGKGDEVTYEAFYEWYPNTQKLIATKDFAVHKGDDVSVTVTITKSGTAAKATFHNKKTGKSYTTPEFYSPGEKEDATGINAQWVVERPPGKTLAHFGKIDFTDCHATDKKNKQHNLKGGKSFNLVVGGKTLAEAKIKGDHEVEVTYKG